VEQQNLTDKTGHTLERLVRRLESLYCDSSVSIVTRERVISRSGVSREVDVVLRGRVGSVDTMVAFECRDRRSTDEVDWIEQLATKRAEIRADRMVAVSSSGFSKGARQTATSVNVELRTVEEVERTSIEWLNFDDQAVATVLTWIIREVKVFASATDEAFMLFPGRTIPDLPILAHAHSDQTAPISSLLDRRGLAWLTATLSDAEVQEVTVVLEIDDPANATDLVTSLGRRPVRKIELNLTAIRSQTPIALSGFTAISHEKSTWRKASR